MRLWDAQSGQEVRVLTGHTNAVSDAAFSPDSTRIVSCSDDFSTRIWEVATGREISVLRGMQTLLYLHHTYPYLYPYLCTSCSTGLTLSLLFRPHGGSEGMRVLAEQ